MPMVRSTASIGGQDVVKMTLGSYDVITFNDQWPETQKRSVQRELFYSFFGVNTCYYSPQ